MSWEKKLSENLFFVINTKMRILYILGKLFFVKLNNAWVARLKDYLLERTTKNVTIPALKNIPTKIYHALEQWSTEMNKDLAT